MSGYLKLPLSFDLARLQQELAAIDGDAWSRHFNTGDYEGDWSCVPLRSVDGRSDHILPLDGARYADTAWLQRSPYLREVIDSFRCEKTSVRLMALAPGARIREHRDPGTAIEQGVTRVHVPIQTCGDALFRIDGEVVHFSAGDAWYLDATSLHGVENRGARPRVHLMLDCVTNPWLETLFRGAGWQPRQPPTAEERALLGGRVEPYVPGQSLRGWYPVTMHAGARGEPVIGWRHLGDKPLREAFFQDSLRGQAPGERRSCHAPAAALAEFGDGVAPTAFVFHVSRCGSTLVTQMLATLPQCIVLSEPPVLDAFFRLHHRDPRASGGPAVLRGLLAALGQRRSGREQHCIVKLDSWHTPWMPLLRKLFPRTPFVFLYRRPQQVLESHRRQRGRQMVPGLVDTSRLQHDAAGLQPGDLDGYAQRVLDAVFEAGWAGAATSGPDLVNYSELPEAVPRRLMPAWGIHCSEADLQAVRARAAFHSKHRGSRFEGDPPDEAPAPWSHTGRAASCYEALERLRLGRGA